VISVKQLKTRLCLQTLNCDFGKLFTVNHKPVSGCVWRTSQPCQTEHKYV